MNIDQFNTLRDILREIRDRLPAPEATVKVAAPAARPTASTPGSLHQVAKSQALYAVLCELDGWIEAAQQHHDDMEHRDENVGHECWRIFAPSDIRHMINGAAKHLGIGEFPLPDTGREDVR
jgi:hypothetical protein